MLPRRSSAAAAGFIFQFFNLVPTMSAWENVALPRLLDNQSLRKAKPEAVALLEQVGLGDRIDHRPNELSGGQMQRVAIARSLIMDPAIVLADEPTGNLDSRTGRDVLDLATLAHDRPDRLVVMVTHDANAWRRRPTRSSRCATGGSSSDGVAARLRGRDPVRLLNLREIVTHRLRVVTSLSVIVVASALLVAVFGTFGSLTGSVRDLTAALTGDADLEIAAISDSGLPADLAGSCAVSCPVRRPWSR